MVGIRFDRPSLSASERVFFHHALVGICCTPWLTNVPTIAIQLNYLQVYQHWLRVGDVGESGASHLVGDGELFNWLSGLLLLTPVSGLNPVNVET